MQASLDAEVKSCTASAPGRVNLIGDHTDYTGGLALPAALPWRTNVTATPRDGAVCVETTFDGVDHTDVIGLLDDASTAPPHLQLAQFLARRVGEGATLSVSSTVPVGAGLSSSAAYCVAVALALGASGDPWTIARLCQEAEAAAGANVGLLDQIAALCGEVGHAVFIDFSAETTKNIALPEGTELLIVDSGERRSLATSAYGERRQACERAAHVIGPLAQASLADLELFDDELLRRRARHVLTENQRVRDAVEAAAAHDAAGFGQLMNESHESLTRDFEVSTGGIDALAATIRSSPGIYGARMTGGGFGGCVIALTESGAAQRLDLSATNWVITPSAGANLEDDEDEASSR